MAPYCSRSTLPPQRGPCPPLLPPWVGTGQLPHVRPGLSGSLGSQMSISPHMEGVRLRLCSRQQFQKSLFSFKTDCIERPAGQWVWGQSSGKSCKRWACRVDITRWAVPTGGWPDRGQRAALRPPWLVQSQPRVAEAKCRGLPVGSTRPRVIAAGAVRTHCAPGPQATRWGSYGQTPHPIAWPPA